MGSALEVAGGLDRLGKHEAKMEKVAIAAYVVWGTELQAIQEEADWKRYYTTWEGYCKQRWGIAKSHVNRLVKAAGVARQLKQVPPGGQKPPSLPPTEKHARPLTKVPEAEVPAAWEYVTAGKAPEDLTVDLIETRLGEWRVAEEERRAPTEPEGDELDEEEGEEDERWEDEPEEEAEEPADAEASDEGEQESAPSLPDAISLPAWKTLTQTRRRAALAVRSKTSFNEQKSDKIEWARWSWNPVTGCEHGCNYCYARELMESRFQQFGFAPTLHPKRLGAPAAMKLPAEADEDIGWKNVFTCSMADLFGRWVPTPWVEAVLEVIKDAPDWNFLLLTKNPRRLLKFAFPPNVWIGTTVERQSRVKTAEEVFRQIKATIRFVSIEPMLEPIKFSSLSAFHWVILGGASRTTATPEWTPPRKWLHDVTAQAWKVKCAVYEKPNCGISGPSRLREYPSVLPEVIDKAPSEFFKTYDFAPNPKGTP